VNRTASEQVCAEAVLADPACSAMFERNRSSGRCACLLCGEGGKVQECSESTDGKTDRWSASRWSAVLGEGKHGSGAIAKANVQYKCHHCRCRHRRALILLLILPLLHKHNTQPRQHCLRDTGGWKGGTASSP